MFTLLTPAALLALLGLLVPVAIHLWNRRPGREVAVGSLRWLAAGANRRLRTLKAEQLWLLMLRAALLALLAVAVAGPVWREQRPPGRGQVLLSPELFQHSSEEALKPTVDSLRRRGYTLRWLTTGFPKLSGNAWGPDTLVLRDSARVLRQTDASATRFRWARVQQAAAAFTGQPLYVATPATLTGFQGSHAPLPAGVTWQMVPSPASRTWLQAAARRGDSLALVLGHSNATQTRFQQLPVSLLPVGQQVRVPGLPPLRLETRPDGWYLQQTPAPADSMTRPLPVPVLSRPLRAVVYYSPDYEPDAHTLRAALLAARVGLSVPLTPELTTVEPAANSAPDWLFWLTDNPLPKAWREAVRRGTRVWKHAAAPGRADTARVHLGSDHDRLFKVFRRTSQPPITGAAFFPLWTDALGRAVLSRQLFGQGSFYQLHTRLHPAWSELAESPALPAQLLTLLQPAPHDHHPILSDTTRNAFLPNDLRTLDPAQLRGAGPEKAGAAPSIVHTNDLRPWLVLAAGLLFLLERLLASRRPVANVSTPS